MNKEEIIKQRGQAAWDKKLGQSNKWNRANPERDRESSRNWRLNNPEKVEENNHEHNRKGGKGYPKELEYQQTGLQGERNKVRAGHRRMWRQYKRIIAPDSIIHHEWRPGTANYNGVAIVEKDQHQYGIIDVIQVLDGEIKVFTEKEIREKGKRDDRK